MRLNRYVLPAALLGLAACGSNDAGNGSAAAEDKAAPAGGAEIQLKPGQWEIVHEVVAMEMPGMPKGAIDSMAGKPTTIRNCITPEQAARPQADFFAENKDSGCTYKDFTMAGGRIKGTMTCAVKDKPGGMTMVMDGKYGPQSYEMNVDMKTDAGAHSMSIQSRGTGKWIGECPADAPG